MHISVNFCLLALFFKIKFQNAKCFGSLDLGKMLNFNLGIRVIHFDVTCNFLHHIFCFLLTKGIYAGFSRCNIWVS